MSNVVITSAGLDYVLSASNNDNINIKVEYFVPVYDYRIDGNIQNPATTSAFSAIADYTLTEPVGEVLWNVSSTNYTQSDANTYLISASNYSSDPYTSPFQTQSLPINLLNDVPLSNHLSGTLVGLSGTSWEGIDSGVTGSNSRPTSTSTDYFPVTDYYPVRTSAGSDELRGNFRCVLNKDIGKIKFNKVALYAVTLVDGVVQVGSEHFFAEAYLNEPITKAGLAQEGFDSLVMDFQIDLHSVSANWSEVFFGTSGDYWSTTVNGLHSSQKISIGVFDSTQTPNGEPQATVHAGQPSDVSGNYERIPQLRLDYPNSVVSAQKTFTMEISGDGNAYLSATEQDLNILPLINQCRLGDLTYPFDRFTFSAQQATYGTPSDAADGNVRIRSSDATPNGGPYFQLYKNSIKMFDDPTSANGLTQTSHNTFYGGDIVRDNNDLLMQTRYQNIYVIAGATNNASITDDQGDRHTNNRDMAKNYEESYDADNVFSGTSAITNSDDWLYNSNYIVARNGNKLMGTVELTYIPRSWTDDLKIPYTSASSVMTTKRKYMTIGVGFLSATDSLDWYDSYERYLYNNAYTSELSDSNSNSDFDPFDDGYIADSSKLFIAASQIRTYGDIKPGSNETWKLGDYEKKWEELHTRFLNVGTTDFNSSDDNYESNLYGAIVQQQYIDNPTGTNGKKRRTVIRPSSLPSLEGRGDVDSEELYIGNANIPVNYIYGDNASISNAWIGNLSADNYYNTNGSLFGSWNLVGDSEYSITLQGGTTSSPTFTSDVIKYTKIGNFVYMYFEFIPTFASGSLTAVKMTWSSGGLPDASFGGTVSPMYQCMQYDRSNHNSYKSAVVFLVSSNRIEIYSTDNTTFVTGKYVSGLFVYESA